MTGKLTGRGLVPRKPKMARRNGAKGTREKQEVTTPPSHSTSPDGGEREGSGIPTIESSLRTPGTGQGGEYHRGHKDKGQAGVTPSSPAAIWTRILPCSQRTHVTAAKCPCPTEGRVQSSCHSDPTKDQNATEYLRRDCVTEWLEPSVAQVPRLQPHFPAGPAQPALHDD